MTIRIPNSTQAQRPPAPPTRPDGTLYAIEIIYGGGRWRGYADTHEQALSLLITDYADLTDDETRLRARIRAAVDIQVALQAVLAAGEQLQACNDTERQLLLASRDTPPLLEVWRAPVPLVLVTSFYQPIGPHPRPIEADAGEIWWVDPTTATTLLESLNSHGWLQLNQLDVGASPSAEADTD
ncbi:hypothetical protein ACFY4C_41310 [Actinomadura viridis]|uniref:hypothetical protein n=1 Tax=Actinomadura viridis TaxID=58110 RepID=UPI0036A9C82E